MSGVTIQRRKEDGVWGNNAYARPGRDAVAILGDSHAFGFDSQRIGSVPVVVFQNEGLLATQGGIPIETIDEGELSAVPLLPGHAVEIHRRPGFPIGRNGVTSLVVQASMESEY